MMHRRFLLISTSLFSLASLSPAMAQSADTDAAIEEIVVTAQRVEQNLQDVPIAVTAVGAEQLRDANVTDATRLEGLAPGLTIGRSGTDLRPAIRGVRTENVGANADPTIGFFVDGVYQSRPSQALAAFVDLERVEVLRGPQGTLFGRNTYGGAISLVSARPTQDLGGGIDLLYGRFDRIRAAGHVNLPVNENVAFRLAAAYENADGYVKNIGLGNDLGDEDQFYIRPSARFQNDIVDLTVRFGYWRQKGASLGAFGYKSRGTMIDPALISATNSGRTLTNGAVFVPVNTRIRDGVADLNGFDIGVPVLDDPYEVNFDTDQIRDNEMYQGSVDLSIKLGDLTLRSITGYTDWYSFRNADNDFSQFPIAIDYNVTDAETFSQEVQLVGPSGGQLEWIAGAFYYNDKVTEVFFNDQNNAYPAAGTPAASGPPFQAGLPSSGPFALGRGDSITPVSVRTRSLAGFAQATYRFTDQFAVTAGIRYTEDKKRYSRQIASGPNLTFASGDTAPFTQQNQRATFDKFTWRIGAEFKPTDDNLLYAHVSTGFTSGGFNGGTFTQSGVVTPLPPFDPQTITAYEVGSKNRFMGGMVQLNASVFYNDLSGLQVQSQVPFGGTVLSITGNAGSARSYGAEVELLTRPVDGLTVGINATYLNAKYKRLLLNNPFPNPTAAAFPCDATTQSQPLALRVGQLVCISPAAGSFVRQIDLEGARIPYSPRVTLQGFVSYDIETSFGTITPSAQTLFNSGYFNTDFNTLVDKQGSFTKTDLRLTWTSADERFSGQLYVENVEDEAVNQRGVFGANQSLNASYAMPRTYGIKLGAKF